MKKFTNLLIVCSLAFAGAVMAQQPTPEQSPSKKQAPPKQAPQKAPAATHTPKPQAPATSTAPATTKQEKHAPPTHTQSPAAAATPAADKHQSPHNNKNMKANTSPSATPAAKTTASPATAKTTPGTAKTTPSPAAAKTTATPATSKTTATPAAAGATTTPAAKTTATAATTPATAASASTAPSVSPANSPATANAAAAAKKPDPQKVQQIKQQHASFRAEPRPDRVPAVTFSAGFRLPGAEHWQGPQYEVYRSYHPERHDQGWYHSHYQRVELVAGGYYYFNNGYWYPAWGYNPSHEYYAYDAPIYVGHHSEPPDRVIADVQAALQEMGYYKGEVDGLLGPLTREALTAYQTDNGMQVTAVIDEPTLDSLNMG